MQNECVSVNLTHPAEKPSVREVNMHSVQQQHGNPELLFEMSREKAAGDSHTHTETLIT